jgi:predicted translin family RNA/ssDNA-binding protein
MSQSLEVLKTLTGKLTAKDVQRRLELKLLREIVRDCFRADCATVHQALKDGKLPAGYFSDIQTINE